MDNARSSIQIDVQCPTCGCADFRITPAAGDPPEIVECASCGRTLGKDELLLENTENLTEHAIDFGKEIAAKSLADFRCGLRKTLSGKKHIRFK